MRHDLRATRHRHLIGLMIVAAAVALLSVPAWSMQANADNPEAMAGVEQRCLKAGLLLPKPLRGIVSRPGDRKKQNIYSDGYYRPMPEFCHGVVRRIPLGKLQIQNPRNHKRWFNLIPYSSPELTNPDPKAETFRVGDEGGKTRISYFPFPFEITDERKRYRCTPGKRVTHVRALYKTVVREVSSGEIVARTGVRRVPIKVRPIKPGTGYNGAVPRAC